MNPIFIRFIFNAFTVFALLFFASRVAFSATLEELEGMCRKSSDAIAKLNCSRLGGLLDKVRRFGEVPADGRICKEANSAYDQFADTYYLCAGAGTSEKGSCFSICRDVADKIQKNQFEKAAQLKRDPASNIGVTNALQFAQQRVKLCNQFSRDAMKIRFSTVKVPSCEFERERKPAEYIDPYTVRRTRNSNPGFKPIEEVEIKPGEASPAPAPASDSPPKTD